MLREDIEYVDAAWGGIGHVTSTIPCLAPYKSIVGMPNKTFVQHRQPAIFMLSRI